MSVYDSKINNVKGVFETTDLKKKKQLNDYLTIMVPKLTSMYLNARLVAGITPCWEASSLVRFDHL